MQDISNARSDKQVQDMRDLEAARACLFCPEGLGLKGKRVFHRGNYWYVTPNDFPYTGSTVHVMIVPSRHVMSIPELKPEELLEFPEMVSWVTKEFDIKGASMFCRFGDTNHTGATIHHLHFHIVQGVPRSDHTDPLFALIGFKKPA